jgi:hypothetical protein
MSPSAKEEADWDSAMRERVTTYIQGTRVTHGAIGDAPAWKVFPIGSLWAIEKGKALGQGHHGPSAVDPVLSLTGVRYEATPLITTATSAGFSNMA